MNYKDDQRETVNRVNNNASYNSSAGPKKRKSLATQSAMRRASHTTPRNPRHLDTMDGGRLIESEGGKT